MSQPSNSKGKEISGKKYASLNVNQTYKGTKVESRSAAGQTRHGGLQSLGKVAQNRRLPPPANLPSLKKENLGNDPTVNLVPSRSSGWGKKEKSTGKPEDQAPTTQQKTQKIEQAQEISLRPNAGVAVKNQSEQGRGWSNLQTSTGSAQQPQANSFQREFPRLGGDAGGQSTQESVRELDLDERGKINDSTIVQQRPNEQKWMAGQGPGQMPMVGPGVKANGPRMDFNFPRDQQRPVFNGAHMQPPGSQFYPPFAPGMVPPYMQMMPHPYPYPYPSNRMPPPSSMSQQTRPTATVKSEESERPATVKQEDIQNMDDDFVDGGWAGAQEEVDYTAKLNFDESDDEPEVIKKHMETKSDNKSSESTIDDKDLQKKEKTENRNQDGRSEKWEEQPAGFQGQMQYRHPQWMGGPFPPHYDPSRGPPSQGYPYPPPPWMYQMPGTYRMPGMPQQRNADGGSLPLGHAPVSQGGPSPVPEKEEHKDSERAPSFQRRKKTDEADREEEKRRAKAAAKYQELEAKRKQRGEMERRRESESSNMSGRRERFDSENSDSSRGGSQRAYTDKYSKSTRETPPRFKKQNTLAKGGKGFRTDSNSPLISADGVDAGTVTQIMKRRDSFKSDDASSVHSQDSWVNIPTNEVEDRRHQANRNDSAEAFPSQQKQEKSYMNTCIEASTKKSDIDKSSDKGEKRIVEGESRLSHESAAAQKSEQKTHGKFDTASNEKDLKGQEEIKREAKKETRKYDYRQGKVKVKDIRADSRSDKKDDYDSWNRSRDDRKYRGKEQSSRWKDKEEYKSEGRKDNKQEEASAKKITTEWVSSDSKSEQDKIDKHKEGKAKGSERYSEDKSKDSSYRTHKSTESTKSRPLFDNFKKLEKTKAKNMAVKLSQSKEDTKDKFTDKTQQVKEPETRKPSAWSHVVSGEKNEGAADSSGRKDESQPKKSLREIQEEEEMKENEKNKSLEKEEQEKLRQEVKDRPSSEQDMRRQQRTIRDRKYDDRGTRRSAYDRYDDSYQDRKEYRRKPESTRDKKGYYDYRDKERYGSKDEASSGRNDKEPDRKRSGYEDKKSYAEDRKRKHEDTERNADSQIRIEQADLEDGVFEEKKTETNEGRQTQESSERTVERRKYSDRGRSSRDGRVSSYVRGRGRTSYSSRSSYNHERTSTSKVTQQFSQESLSDNSEESPKHEANEGANVKSQGGKTDQKKGKENKEPERKETSQPYKRYEEYRRGPARSRDDFNDYQSSRYRYERRDDSRGRGRGRGFISTAGARPAQKRGTYESKHSSESAKPMKSSTTDEKDLEQIETKRKDKNEVNTQREEGSDYEDDDDDYTDESDIDEKKENADKSKEQSYRKDYKIQSRGRGRGQISNRNYTDRSHDDRKHDGTYKSGKVPPRFQRQIEGHSEHYRGRGVRVRGSRGRGRSYPTYGTRGRGFGRPHSTRDHKSNSTQVDDTKDGDVSGESDDDDDTFHSADGSLASADEEATKDHKHHKKDSDYSKRYSNRGKTSYRSGSARGRGACGGRSGNANHFLGDRQQERVSHINTSEWAMTLPAADKSSFAGSKFAEDNSGAKHISYVESKTFTSKRQTDIRGNGPANGTTESLSEFSEPPKKMAKSRTSEKLDIMRQFDVNNIASVVCIDDIPQNIENVENVSLSENDGFVQVTSRKAQKFLRERQKEEEKRKMQEEVNAKPVKKTSFDSKEAFLKQGKAQKFPDHSHRVTHSYPHSSGQISVSDVTQSQTSNAAMAAVGGWEPAQALLRGVQAVATTDATEASKAAAVPAPPPAMNAWKRPLSFASSLSSTTTTASHSATHSVPDPKAVGTGKPNSSPAKQLPNIQTSPSGDVSHSVSPGYKEIPVSDEAKQQPVDSQNKDTSNSNDPRQKQVVTRKPEPRKINKGTKRETAPRFQNITKSKSVMMNNRLVNGDITQQKKKISATTEDVSALEVSTLQGEDRAPGKRPDGSKLRRCNSESSKEEPVSGLPVLKNGERPVISFIQDEPKRNTELVNGDETTHNDIIIDKRQGKVEVPSRSKDEESAKDTARSVIKSLGDDDEKNLETRSLPSSTPPLVVEIHAPRSNGPSSDPGKRPTIPVSHSLTQEVNEMSMKVLSAKKIWDNIPTPVSEISVVPTSNTMNTWSEEDGNVNASSSAASVPSNTVENVERGSSKEHVTSQAAVAVVTAQSLNKTDEVNTSEPLANSGLVSKKTIIEPQNNVCKVKPQQKQSQQTSVEDKRPLITSFSNAQLFPPQFSFQQSYALPIQSSSSHSKLQQPYVTSDTTHSTAIFPQQEAAHRELPNQHSQPQVPVNIQQVNQVRPTSPLSHHHQDILQPSVMLGNISNIYGTQAIQGTQQSQVLWPVISRNAMPPTSSYLSQQQSHEQQSDILNSSASFPSTPMYMTFDQGSSTILSAQRLNSQMQQTQTLGLVMPQQTLRSGSMLNIMRANQTTKESQMFSMSLSPSPFHHNNDVQIPGASQSDMTKHVNAKPFQPSSRTPPSAAQSSNIMNHHHSQLLGHFNKLIGAPVNLQQQQQPGNQQLNEHQHSSISFSDKQRGIQQHTLHAHSVQQPSQVLAVQPHAALQHSTQQPSAVQHQLQPIQQHVPQQPSGHQHFVQHHSFQTPHVAAVGPRSVQNRTVTDSPTLQSQTRIGTLSPVDPNLQFIPGTSSVKTVHQTRQHSHLMQPSNHSGSIVQVMQQNQAHPSHTPTRPFIVRPSQALPKFQHPFPGPIKRPAKTQATQPLPINKPKQPVMPMVKTTDANESSATATSQVASSFRNEEHQKMIEETKKYFASQNKSDVKPTVVSSSSKASSTALSAQTSSTISTPVQTILVRPVEKKAIEETQPIISKDETKEIPAAAMLNDPADIDSIIKSNPSLAKAFNKNPAKSDKGIRLNNKRNFQKRNQDKEEQPKRAEIITNSTSKVDQKAGNASQATQRPDRNKTAQKVKTDGNAGKR